MLPIPLVATALLTVAAILAQTMETIETASRMVDKAAEHNDRWLFIATLVLLLAFVALAIRWLITSIERKDKAHADEREKVAAELKDERRVSETRRKEDQTAFLASLNKFDDEITRLTDSQRETTKVLMQHDHDMREAHRVETAVLVRSELARLGIEAK